MTDRDSPDIEIPAEEIHGARTLGYMPSLDGLRAVAVLSVMAFHGGVPAMSGGYFGVDLFFVLSGFLITSLLLAELNRTKRIALGAFWARRARRLVPALLAVIVFVVLYARFIAPPGTYPGLRGDSIATLFYFANWHFIFTGNSYFAQTGQVSPLLHTWSLAIEEQFYLLWPLIVLFVGYVARRMGWNSLKALFSVSVAGALASAAAMALLYKPGTDPTRVYFGTDTHAQCLLVGAATATGFAIWRRSRSPVPNRSSASRLLTLIAVVGLAMCLVAFTQLDSGHSLVFRGGFLLFALAVAGVLVSVVLHPRGSVPAVLSWTPLRYLGRISYGMYLWHFPLFIALTATRVGLRGLPLFGVRLFFTVVVATISFYCLETPIRTGRWFKPVSARLVSPLAAVGVVALVLVTTATPAVSSTTEEAGAVSASTNTAGIPKSLQHAPVRVLLLGDSVAVSLGKGLQKAASSRGMSIANQGILGCGVAQSDVVRSELDGVEQAVPMAYACRDAPTQGYVPWPDAWRSWLSEVKPNVVVLLAGRWEVADLKYQGRFTNILNPKFAAYVKQELVRAVTIGTSTGAPMVLMTAPCFDPGEQPNGAPFPEDNPMRLIKYNQILKQVADKFPKKVVVQNLFAVACPGGRYVSTLNGVPFRPDGIHFDAFPGTGSALIAGKILPLWEYLGHGQEAAGGSVISGPLPPRLSVS